MTMTKRIGDPLQEHINTLADMESAIRTRLLWEVQRGAITHGIADDIAHDVRILTAYAINIARREYGLTQQEAISRLDV